MATANKSIAQPAQATIETEEQRYSKRRSVYLELEKKGSKFTEAQGFRAFFVSIDAKLAGQILGTCLDPEKQRKLRPTHAALLTDQMKSGEFTFQGDTIRFDKEYRLCDGQHRLTAIVQSGQSHMFLVVSGIQEQTTAYIDQNARVRNMVDRIKIGSGHELTALEQSVFNFLVYGRSGKNNTKSSIQDNLDKWNQFERCVRFASRLKATHALALRKASVRVPVARAYYLNSDNPEIVERLEQFLHIIDTQFPKNTEEDSAALVLAREYRNKPVYRAAGADSTWGVQMYWDSEYLLNKFLKKEDVTSYPRRRARYVELWPIEGTATIDPPSSNG